MKKDISAQLGLPGELDLDSGRVELGVSSELEIFRTLDDLAKLGVVADSAVLTTEQLSTPLTYIYRMLDDDSVRKSQGVEAGSDGGVKFDVTSLVSHRQLGDEWTLEYPKTSGHYHTALPGSQYASPDFYQVVSGEGIIMLQHVVDGDLISKAVHVKEGDTLLIAPHLGHTSINLGDEPLVFTNVCVRRPHLNYEDIHRYGGAPYFVRRNPDGSGPIFEVNDAYARDGLRVMPLEFVESDWTVIGGLGIQPTVPIFEYIANPNIVAMLCHPDPHHAALVSALKPTA